MDIPLELIELILSKVKDNKTIFSCRLVNKLFNNYFTPLKLYDRKVHIETVFFISSNQIKSYFPNGKLKIEQNVGYLGKTKFNEYNECGTLICTINVIPPFKLKKQNVNMNTIDIVNYDIKKEKENKSHLITNMQCVIF